MAVAGGWRNSEAGAGAGPGTTTSVMPIPAPLTSPGQCRGIQSHVRRKGNYLELESFMFIFE